jgi:hypothetical protein
MANPLAPGAHVVGDVRDEFGPLYIAGAAVKQAAKVICQPPPPGLLEGV